MSFNNVVPGDVLRDPEKLASLMKAMGYDNMEEPVIPGTEDWVPEDETPEAKTMDEVGTGNFVFRVVDAEGHALRSNSNISGVYLDEGWAKHAVTGFKGNRYKRRWYKLPFRIQRARIEWTELED